MVAAGAFRLKRPAPCACGRNQPAMAATLHTIQTKAPTDASDIVSRTTRTMICLQLHVSGLFYSCFVLTTRGIFAQIASVPAVPSEGLALVDLFADGKGAAQDQFIARATALDPYEGRPQEDALKGHRPQRRVHAGEPNY